MVDYNDIEEYLDWTKKKAELKFDSTTKSFPILYNCIIGHLWDVI